MAIIAITADRVRELADDDEALRLELKADLLPPAIEAIRLALQPRCKVCKRGAQRWAVRNVLELAKLVGAQPQVMIAVFQKFGVASESELTALVAGGKRLEAMKAETSASLEEYRDRALELLDAVLKERPEWHAEVAKRLGGWSQPQINGGSQ